VWKARMGQLLINFLSLSVADLRGEEVRVAPIPPATRSPSASPLGGPDTTDASGCWFWSMARVATRRVCAVRLSSPREPPSPWFLILCSTHHTESAREPVGGTGTEFGRGDGKLRRVPGPDAHPGTYWVTLRARWVTLRARWVTLRARWVTLRARWVTLRARWVTLRARWVTLRARWVTLRARWVTLRARWVTLRARWVMLRARWVTLGARWVTLRARWVTLRARANISRKLTLYALPTPAPAECGVGRGRTL
jgi:hypothetical protein